MDWIFWVVTGVTAIAGIVVAGAIVYAVWPEKIVRDQNDILNQTLNDLPDANRYYPYK